jgi:hypothetical protein
MPELKQPMRLEEMGIRLHINKYCGKCRERMQEFTEAITRGGDAYEVVVKTVVKECREMGNEISMLPPGILKIMSPRLVNKFAKLIFTYGYRTGRLVNRSCVAEEQTSLCKTMFRSVLTRYIEKVDIDTISIKWVEDVMEQDPITQLKQISYRLLFVGDQTWLVTDMVHHLKDLQIFTYSCYCTDEIIAQLQRHCPHLTELDITCSRKVTNASVQPLIEAKKLKFLNLEGTQIDGEHYAMILSELPNIANINIPGKEPSILRHIAEEKLDTITHVRSYLQDIHTLTHKCPNITNIAMGRIARDLSGLTAFNALSVLEIHELYYSTSNLKTALQGVGHRLTDLKLFGGIGVVPQDIITLCPFLANLSLIRCLFERVNTSFDPQLPHFRNLINLKIYNSSDVHSDLSFIRYYVSLKIIDLRVIGIFTVDFVREIRNLGTFKQLEIFHVEEICPGALNMDAVQLLIHQSPLLKRIEIVGRCRHFHRDAFGELKRQIVLQNLDLKLKHEARFPYYTCSADM